MNLNIIFIIFIISITIFFPSKYTLGSSTDPILITISSTMDQVIFDGKWTSPPEWKSSSENKFYDSGMQIILRSAHQDNFLYFYVDVLNDFTLNKGMDKATICIDGKNNKNAISDNDDFCFSATLGNKQGVVFQGGSVIGITGNFQKIPNPENFIGLGNVSDDNNRYSKAPHPSYEFKIPIDLIQRSDNYGFYLSVYEANSHVFFTWPYESPRENLLKIPSPSTWGDIVSPDKSLPELNLPILVFTILIFTIILVQSKTRIGIFRW